jgi:hypothetical protein
MRLSRTVTRAFSAKCYAVEPLRHESLKAGDKIFFLHSQDGHRLYARIDDLKGEHPLSIDDGAIEVNTKPTQP